MIGHRTGGCYKLQLRTSTWKFGRACPTSEVQRLHRKAALSVPYGNCLEGLEGRKVPVRRKREVRSRTVMDMRGVL